MCWTSCWKGASSALRWSARCSLATLHRLFVSGSDRDCADWMADYGIDGAEGLALHHFYRAMAWLGEELGEKAQGALVARCVKDVIEEKLFDRRRDLFTDLSLVFMDTTSLSFYGAGGETLGKRGHSKDFRPDLAQMILALVVDAEGRPICTEMVPGNTADVTVLVPVVDRLRTRFGITRACVVADRGMISADTIAALEKLGMEYILGARERSSSVIRDVVLNDTAPMVPLALERQRGETQLWVKEVKVGKERYIVSRNEAEAKKDKADRQAIIAGLEAQLNKGDKALVGNSAYRRYLKASGKNFKIDLGKLAEEARYDGITVVRTNAKVTPLQAVLRYRDLLEVESLFRAAKATFDTRPIFHQSDAAIRGHVFCSFLALVLSKELRRLCRAKGLTPEWQPLLRDLDRLQEATIEKDGRTKQPSTRASAGFNIGRSLEMLFMPRFWQNGRGAARGRMERSATTPIPHRIGQGRDRRPASTPVRRHGWFRRRAAAAISLRIGFAAFNRLKSGRAPVVHFL